MDINNLFDYKKRISNYYFTLDCKYSFHNIVFDEKTNPIIELFGVNSGYKLTVSNPFTGGFSNEIEFPFDFPISIYDSSNMMDTIDISLNNDNFSFGKLYNYKLFLALPFYYSSSKRFSLNEEKNIKLTNKNLEDKIEKLGLYDFKKVLENIDLFKPNEGKLIKIDN